MNAQGAGYIIERGGFRGPTGIVIEPHIAYLSGERLRRTPKMYPKIAPDFVVEVKSAFCTSSVLQEKIHDILEMGIQAWLLIDPDNFTATLYRSNHAPTSFGEDAEIMLDGMLPGWCLQLSALWV